MWLDMLERIRTSDEVRDPLFWPGVGKEREHTMLLSLFAAAVREGILTKDQIERFLCHVLGMDVPLLHQRSDKISGTPGPRGLSGAMRELLDLDGKLSPLSLKLFGKRVLSEQDREALMQCLVQEQGPARRRSKRIAVRSRLRLPDEGAHRTQKESG